MNTTNRSATPEELALRAEFEADEDGLDLPYEQWLEHKILMIRSAASGSWTAPYVGVSDKGLLHHIRLVPDFMDLEAAGFSHGLALGGDGFPSEAEAQAFAQRVNAFMRAMMAESEL